MNKIKSFLKVEFVEGKRPFDWGFLSFGLILQIFAIIYGYLTGNPDGVIAIISGITGVIAVVLCAQGKISSYVFNYTQLLTYVFGVVIPYALWGEFIENIFYFITMFYGVYVWFKNYGKNKDGSTSIRAKKLSITGWIIWIFVFIVCTIGFTFVLSNAHIWFPNIFNEADPKPFLDSITTISPFIGQILLVLGYRDQWVFWIIEDIVSVIMFVLLGNWVMTAQYIFWTINCIYGFILWTNYTKEGIINE